MKKKALILAMIAAGLIIAATSAAFGTDPTRWFSRESPASVGSAVGPMVAQA